MFTPTNEDLHTAFMGAWEAVGSAEALAVVLDAVGAGYRQDLLERLADLSLQEPPEPERIDPAVRTQLQRSRCPA